MGKAPPHCSKDSGLNRGAWNPREDMILTDYITLHGHGEWKSLPQKAGLKRNWKSCRMRWLNYLRPGIKRGNISEDEEELIIRLHALLGNRWSLIAGRLQGRTDNEIKNYWNSHLRKKMTNRSSAAPHLNEKLNTSSKSPSNGVDTLKIDPLLQSNHTKSIADSETWCESWADELITDINFELVDIDKKMNNTWALVQSPTMEIYGQHSSFYMINEEHSSPDWNLHYFPCISWTSNAMEQIENCAICNEQ